MGLRSGFEKLLRLPPLRWIAGAVAIWRQVYGSMGTDPTYHPQRDEDRLAEARRIVALGDPAEVSKPPSAVDPDGRGDDKTISPQGFT
ncbi:MAG: hypothetical protein ACYC66_13395 [Chloroflexota bacterium]